MGTLFRFYLDWLSEHGVAFEVPDALVREPDHDGPLVRGDDELRTHAFDGIEAFTECRDPAAGIAADHATESTARAMLSLLQPGWRVWEVGCGTGVLAVSAMLGGARSVIATDLDPRTIRLAGCTAERAGVEVRLLEGSLLEPIPDNETADLVVANLPHKPVPRSVGLKQAGGRDGAAVHTAFVEQADRRLPPGTPVVFFLHSLPHPRLLRRYAESFSLRILSRKRRYLQPGEYGALQERFMQRTREGKSFVAEDKGRRFLIACVWLAVRK